MKLLSSHATFDPEVWNKLLPSLSLCVGPFLTQHSNRHAATQTATQVCAVRCELPAAASSLLPAVLTVPQSLRREQCSAVSRLVLHLLLILIQQSRKADSFIPVLQKRLIMGGWVRFAQGCSVTWSGLGLGSLASVPCLSSLCLRS